LAGAGAQGQFQRRAGQGQAGGGQEQAGQGQDQAAQPQDQPAQGQGRAQRQAAQGQGQRQPREATLPPAGLTAAVTIVVARQDDVLNVPLRALHRQGRAETVDVVGEDGKTAARPVRIGVQNDQSVEIVEGLSEGEQILVPTTTTRAPNVNGPGGPRPGGPGNFQFIAR
jgi:hypothetical protein